MFRAVLQNRRKTKDHHSKWYPHVLRFPHLRSSLVLRRSSTIIAGILLFASLLGLVPGAGAQAASKLSINQVDGHAWPDVGLNLTLVGPDGKTIPDVTAAQFEVREANQPQALAGLQLNAARNVPLALVIAIDVSGSMTGDKLAQAKAAASTLLDSIRPEDRFSLLAFNERVITVVPATNDKGALQAGISALQAQGNTAAYDALYSAAQVASNAPSAQRRVIILLTDGADTASKYSARVAADVSRQTGALVYTIGLGPDAVDNTLKGLAEPTGGKYYKAPAPADLKGIYNAISVELSSQLLLKYGSTTHVAHPYDFILVEVKCTLKDGQTLVQTARYRPPLSAITAPTPQAAPASAVAAPLVVPLPAGVGRVEEAVGTARIPSGAVEMMALVASVLAGVAVLLFAGAAMMLRSPSTASRRLMQYVGGQVSTDSPEIVRTPSFGNRVVAPFVSWLGRHLSQLSPKSYTQHVQNMLILAGPPYRMQVAGFIGIQAVAAVGVTLPLMYWVIKASPDSPPRWVLVGIFGLMLGIYLPYFRLARRVSNRRKGLLKALPGALDFLAINVEAGMGFDAALSEVVRRWRNVLTDEFALLLIDFQIGRPRKDAWKDLIQRTQVPDLTSFVTAMLQNEQVGSSISTLLRTQAEHMRVRRRQRAEETARVAPVKMLLPMVFFIFPGILVVLLGPAIPQFLDAFGGK